MGAHMIAIKDMAGLCRPYAAAKLVKVLRSEVGVPIHFHTHDTSGINASSVLSAADAGVDVVDLALASMSGSTTSSAMFRPYSARNQPAASSGSGPPVRPRALAASAEPTKRLLRSSPKG